MKNEKGFIGYFEINEKIEIKKDISQKYLDALPIEFAYIQKNFLSKSEIDYFHKIIQGQVEVPVGSNGYYDDYSNGDKIGSYRGTIFSKEIAEIFFKRLKGVYPEERDFKESLNSDHDNHSRWEFVGVNPLLRFIKYRSGGELVPHYDAPYIANDKERTLVTMVIYLTNNKSGKTRFIRDPQEKIPVAERVLDDWEEHAKAEDIIFSIYPEAGKIALFDHRVIHDSEELKGEEKIIIRTDLVFRKV